MEFKSKLYGEVCDRIQLGQSLCFGCTKVVNSEVKRKVKFKSIYCKLLRELSA